MELLRKNWKLAQPYADIWPPLINRFDPLFLLTVVYCFRHLSIPNLVRYKENTKGNLLKIKQKTTITNVI